MPNDLVSARQLNGYINVEVMELITARDLAYWLEAECYCLKRLEEQPNNQLSKSIAAIRVRLWRIHEILEQMAGQPDVDG